MTWVRLDREYELTWVRVDREYEITWVRIDLVQVDLGYELTVNQPNSYVRLESSK